MDAALQAQIKGFNTRKLKHSVTEDSAANAFNVGNVVAASRASPIPIAVRPQQMPSAAVSPVPAKQLSRESGYSDSVAKTTDGMNSPLLSGKAGSSKKKKKRKKHSSTRASRLNSRKSSDPATGGASTIVEVSHLASIEESEPFGASSVVMGWVILLVFLASLDFSIVLPSMYPFIQRLGGDLMDFGVIFGIYNVAQLVAAVILHFWTKHRSIKEALFFCACCVLVGNTLYFSADSYDKIWMLYLGRSLSGCGSGIVILGYAHIARFSARSSAPARIASYRLMESFASIIGPGIGALAIHLDFMFFMTVDAYTIGSFVTVLLMSLYIILLVVSSFGFWKPKGFDITRLLGRNAEEEYLHDDDGSGIVRTLSYSEIAVLMVIFLALTVSFWAFEAALFPAVRDGDWSLLKNYLLFVFMGGVHLVCFAIYKLSGMLDTNMKSLLCSLIVMTIGCIVLTINATKLPTWQLYISGGLLAAGYSVGTTQLPSLFVRMADDKVTEDFGSKMTSFFASIAFARTVGPIWGAAAYKMEDLNLMAYSCALLLVLGIIVGVLTLTQSRLTAESPNKSSLVLTSERGRAETFERMYSSPVNM